AKELRGLQVLYLMSEAGMIRLEEERRATTPSGSNPAAVNLDELKAYLAKLEKQNYFEVLGIQKTSTPADAKKAYFALAKKYHPDTLPVGASGDHRKLIESIFSIVSRA